MNFGCSLRKLGGRVAMVVLAATVSAIAPAQTGDTDTGLLVALRDVDQRLATIAYRLATANAALCRDLAPTPGWVVHAIDQYDAAQASGVRQVFGFAGPVAIEAIVADGPAARAGVRANDTLVAIDGKPVPKPSGAKPQPSSATRDAVTAQIAARPPTAPLKLTLLRERQRVIVTVPPSPGCRSAFEVLVGPDMTAGADGSIVQIGSRYFERYTDAQIAVVVAHELAHNILRHRARLDAAKVSRGVLSELGRNGRLFRRTEDDADLMGLHLLRNAGYDPASAPRFWRQHGGDIDGGLFRSRTHASSKARAEALEAEISRIPRDAPRPYHPPVLDTRDEPLR